MIMEAPNPAQHQQNQKVAANESRITVFSYYQGEMASTIKGGAKKKTLLSL